MPAALKICLYFLAVLVLGAALAPVLFWAGQASGVRFLRETEFPRYFNRAVFLAALLLLPLAARAMAVRGWTDFGLTRNPRAGRDALAGFALAAGGLAALVGIGLAAGAFRWKTHPAGVVAATLGGAALSAAGVAAVEELFFRGALQGLIARSARARGRPGWGAMVFVAALFAILHFLKPPAGGAPGGAVGWGSGFEQLPRTFWQFGRPGLVAAGWTTLFLVGLILGWARLRTGSLWAGIGLHAGWVFALKTFSKFTRRAAGDAGWPWFGESLLVGVGSVAMLLATGALVLWWLGGMREAEGGRRKAE